MKISSLYHPNFGNYGGCSEGRCRYSYTLLYWTKKYVFVDNFSLKHGNDFIFSDIEVNDKINISWNFCENLSLWRHITSLPVFRRGTCHGHLSKRWPKIGVFDSGTKFGDSKLKKAPNMVKNRKKIIRVKFRAPHPPYISYHIISKKWVILMTSSLIMHDVIALPEFLDLESNNIIMVNLHAKFGPYWANIPEVRWGVQFCTLPPWIGVKIIPPWIGLIGSRRAQG